jgi:Domain of unknown function (DUF4047)
MRKAFHKTIFIPCLCCVSFYSGIQLAGETEATFSSRASPESIEISAAFVFPATIKQLEDRAQEIADSMIDKYEISIAASQDESLKELYERLAEITNTEQELNHRLGALQNVYDELYSFHSHVQSQEEKDILTVNYVREGFQNVDRILKEVKGTVDFERIEVVRSSILLQIKDREEKEKGFKNNTQVNQDQEKTDSQVEETSNQEATNNEQVTVHAETTIENSQ